MAHELEQGAHAAMSLQGVPQRSIEVQTVAIAPADAVTAKDSGRLEVPYDLLHGPLSDAHVTRHVAQAGIRVPRQADEHVRVITQEGPLAGGWRWQVHAENGSGTSVLTKCRKSRSGFCGHDLF
jgi:hypothetical protein